MDGLRNLSDVALEPHPTLNLLTGTNGAGKSSVLEAIHCLSTGHSFRSRKPRELVARERETLTILGRMRDENDEREHRIGLSRHRDGALDLRVDFEAVDSVAPATRLLPVKALSPDSHALVQEGPEERRRFLDWGVFHVEPLFLDSWRRFRRALSQRNRALRDQRDDAEIVSWDEQLAETGTLVDGFRRAYVERLGAALSARTRRLGRAVDTELRYRTGWAEGRSLASSLADNLDHHRRMRTTTDGPHRGELTLSSDGVPVRQTFSRGQQKMLVYLLHLAQLDLMRESGGGEAVVLCDDLLSELDETNGEDLVEQIMQVSCQLFVSGVSLKELERLPHGSFHVELGSVTRRA